MSDIQPWQIEQAREQAERQIMNISQWLQIATRDDQEDWRRREAIFSAKYCAEDMKTVLHSLIGSVEMTTPNPPPEDTIKEAAKKLVEEILFEAVDASGLKVGALEGVLTVALQEFAYKLKARQQKESEVRITISKGQLGYIIGLLSRDLDQEEKRIPWSAGQEKEDLQRIIEEHTEFYEHLQLIERVSRIKQEQQ